MLTTDKIKARNKAFDKLSKRGKRLAVLKDALLISTSPKSKFVVTHGTYGEFPDFTVENTMQTNLLMPGEECKVCARGVMFCSRVRVGNKFEDTKSGISGEDTLKAVKDIFEDSEMYILESIFEDDDLGGDDWMSQKIQKLLTKKYGEYHPEDDYLHEFYTGSGQDRFVKVLKNLIWAKGNFEKGIFRHLLPVKKKKKKN